MTGFAPGYPLAVGLLLLLTATLALRRARRRAL